MDDLDQAATPSPGTSGDGVRIVEDAGHGRRPALLYKILALILAGCFIGYVVMINRTPSKTGHSDAGDPGSDGMRLAAAPSGGSAAGAPGQAAHGQALTARPITPRRDPDDLASYYVPGDPVPTAGEVIDRLNKAGIHSGIGAFSPPGTSPPLIGLAVPDDVVLPEGYVRHSQATDDGQRIEPILMFSPDFEFYDADGHPIKIPPDRVVPPELAPPGIPGRLIKIPPAQTPGSP